MFSASLCVTVKSLRCENGNNTERRTRFLTSAHAGAMARRRAGAQARRREGSSEKSWFGTPNRLYCTPYPSWARFSGLRTNFIRARITRLLTWSEHGLKFGPARMGQSSLHDKIYLCRTNFFGRRTFFIRAVPKFCDSVNGALVKFSARDVSVYVARTPAVKVVN